jgi:hypothetical protein
MSATTGSFSIGNSTVQMPVKTGTLGPSVVDISKLYAQSGMFTYDPGFTSTASCESEVSYIDGEEGVLLYRGYSIEQIAEHGDFLETCYLLLYGQLPNAVQKKDPAHDGSRADGQVPGGPASEYLYAIAARVGILPIRRNDATMRWWGSDISVVS